MATYTGAGQAKRGFSGRTWIAIAAFLAAAALVITLAATRVGSSGTGSSGGAQTTGYVSRGGSGMPHTTPHGYWRPTP